MSGMNKNQCAAARQLLEWTQSDLSAHCGASRRAISDFERGGAQPRRATLDAIEAAFTRAGIRFLECGGVDFNCSTDNPRSAP